MNNAIFLLTIGVGFVSLGFVGPHRFTTILFREQGLVEFGFWSIILIYFFYALASSIAPMVISKIGLRLTLAISAIVYWGYVIALLLPQRMVMLAVSAVLGIAAACFWSSQSLYMVTMSDPKRRGVFAGSANALESLFSLAGVFGFGFLLDQLQFSRIATLAAVSTMCLVGAVVLARLPDHYARRSHQRNGASFLGLVMRSTLVRRLSFLWLLPGYITGFSIGTMPLLLSGRWSLSAVGMFTSLFWAVPLVMSLFSGLLSDRIGRGRVIVIGLSLSLIGSLLVLSPSQITLAVASLLLPVGFNVLRTMSYALLGDIGARKTYLSSLNALHWTAAAIGVLPPLFLGLVGNTLFSVAGLFILTAVTLILSLPLLAHSSQELRMKLNREVE